MLKAVQRLLRQHDYESILFSCAQAFKNHTDIEKAACHPRHRSAGRSGHRVGVTVPVIYITGNANPFRLYQPFLGEPEPLRLGGRGLRLTRPALCIPRSSHGNWLQFVKSHIPPVNDLQVHHWAKDMKVEPYELGAAIRLIGPS
jgi:hypothetical protein